MRSAAKKQEARSDRGLPRLAERRAQKAVLQTYPTMMDADGATAARPEGGSYRPLSQNDVERIHDAALRMLETVGFANAIPSCAAALTKAGALAGADGRIRFPRRLVLDTIARAGRNFSLCGQDTRHDLRLQGKRVHYGTAGAAVHLVDVEKREYRESRLQDIYDAARVADGLENIHFFQRPMVARDIADPLQLDFNTLYACVSGTSKHVGTSFTVRENVKPALEMLYAIAGGEANFRARPFVSNANCFVVPPMKFAEDACGVLEACVEGGMPILLVSAGQAGVTAPASLAGAITQTVAEVLAGLVYVNAISPGHPAIFGAWPFASDPRTGAMAGGSPEQALMTAACAQMAHFYDLPGGSPAGMADAKLPDLQCGYEKGISNALAGLAGLNMVYEAAGMHASLQGFCLESLILDNDILGQCMQCVQGVEVSEETLCIDTVAQVCLGGPGHYRADVQYGGGTPDEGYRPSLADRTTPKDWEKRGKPDIVQRAITQKQRMLAERFPRHIPRSLDEALRSRFGDLILLPRAAMGD